MNYQIDLPESERDPFELLYRRHAPRLLAYIRGNLSSPQDTEDLLMDIFVSALDHQELLLQANYAVQTTWLRRVARNKLVDYYRRQKRHPVVPLDEHIDDLFYDGPEPEQSALRHEEYTWLRTHLKDLSEPQQEILGLRFAAGLRCVEIAHLLKKRDGTVRMLLARALNALRVRYEQQWEEQ